MVIQDVVQKGRPQYATSEPIVQGSQRW